MLEKKYNHCLKQTNEALQIQKKKMGLKKYYVKKGLRVLVCRKCKKKFLALNSRFCYNCLIDIRDKKNRRIKNERKRRGRTD